MLHQDIIPDARGRTTDLPRNSGVAVIFVVELMHPNQLIRFNSLCHGLLAGLGGTRCGFELGIGMRHGLAPAFVDVSAEGLDLRVGAAEFLDHAVDFFKLRSVIPRYGDGLFVGIKHDLHRFFLLRDVFCQNV